MKTACLLLLTIGWAWLMHGMAYAATASPTTGGTPALPGSHEERDSHQVSEKNVARNHVGLVKENRPGQSPNHWRHAPQAPWSAGATAPAFSVRTVKAVAVRQRTDTALQGGLRPQAGTLSNVRPGARSRLWSAGRHRGTNPATVGGLGNRASSNTGSIDGRSMRRRP